MSSDLAIENLELLGNPRSPYLAWICAKSGRTATECTLHVESRAVVSLTKACRQYQDLRFVCLGGHAHAATIDVLGGCVNNAIGLFNALGMSDHQHNHTHANDDLGDSGNKAAASINEEANPFVPAVAEEDLEEVYVDVEHPVRERFLKVPAMGWFVLGGGVFSVVAIFLISVFKSPSLKDETIEVQQMILNDQKENKKEERKTEAYEATRVALEEVKACVRDYYAADKIREKLKHVRQPDYVLGMMEKYYQQQPIERGEFDQLEKYSALDVDGVPFVYARVLMKSGKSHDVLLEQMVDGTYKLDWESEVHYQPLSWDDFIRQRPTKSCVMRVAVKPDNFYVYQFRDSSKYDCYQLTAKNSDRSLYGYVVKGSELSIQLRQFFMRVKHLSKVTLEPMMLEIRFPEGAIQGGCVHIDSLVAPRWFLVRQPDGVLRFSETKTEE